MPIRYRLASAIDRAYKAHNLAAGNLNCDQRASNSEVSGRNVSRL